MTALSDVGAQAEPEPRPAHLLEQGLALAREGDPRDALPILTKAQEASHEAGDRRLEYAATLALGKVERTHGSLCLARDRLEDAVGIADALGEAALRCQAYAELGNTYYLSRRFDRAVQWLRSGLVLARALPDPLQESAILEGLANVAAVGDEGLFRDSTGGPSPEALPADDPVPGEHTPLEKALILYDRSEALARDAEASDRTASVRVNRARALLKWGRPSEAEAACRQALESVRRISDDRLQAFLLVACGRILSQLHEGTPDESGDLLQGAFNAYRDCLGHGVGTQFGGIQSYAFGFLAELYLRQQRLEEADILTENALRLARGAGDEAAVIQWLWQQGRILAAHGETERAIETYRHAAHYLSVHRGDVFIGAALLGDRKPFRESFGKVYLELADLLLAGEPTDRGPGLDARLQEARAAVEMLKLIEVEDYYLEEDCADLLRVQATKVDIATDSRTAILYAIVLDDRTELLLTLPSGMRRYRSTVKAEQLRETVEAFRRQLVRRGPIDHLSRAHQLWDWLLAPLMPDLESAGITTLVFVPDGALRTLPLAALHDGQRFLLERFAVAVSPGLSLMQPRPMPREDLRVLLCGISEAVGTNEPLPSVATELADIQGLLGGRILINGEFRTSAFARELSRRPATIVHLATHAEFGSNARGSYVLTYDQKLTLDELEQLLLPHLLEDRPIELLALSACETAAGSEQAALGLAAVAVKAGARSALATLWPIDDVAAQRVMSGFYQALVEDPTASRAECLRRAQMALMKDRRLRSPSYWSPVVLIGNWL